MAKKIKIKYATTDPDVLRGYHKGKWPKKNKKSGVHSDSPSVSAPHS